MKVDALRVFFFFIPQNVFRTIFYSVRISTTFSILSKNSEYWKNFCFEKFSNVRSEHCSYWEYSSIYSEHFYGAFYPYSVTRILAYSSHMNRVKTTSIVYSSCVPYYVFKMSIYGEVGSWVSTNRNVRYPDDFHTVSSVNDRFKTVRFLEKNVRWLLFASVFRSERRSKIYLVILRGIIFVSMGSVISGFGYRMFQSRSGGSKKAPSTIFTLSPPHNRPIENFLFKK